MILTSVVDSYVRESQPSANFGTGAKLWMNGGTPGTNKFTYIWFPNKVPIGAKVLVAKLRVYLYSSWSGTNTVTAKRITGSWKEGTINWNNKPATSSTNSVAVVVSSGVDKQLVEFDLVLMMQDVANGSPFVGIRLELTEDADRRLRSGEDPDTTLRPTLELEWSEFPDAPDQLAPSGADAVSSASPLLDWRFSDKFGTGSGTLQASSQVQVDDASDFATPLYDSGKVANVESQWNLATAAGWLTANLPDASTRYWRVRVWDGTDFVSEWSAAAEFKRDDLGTLAIVSPGATVPETTPPISWTLTGETQSKYRVTLFEVSSTGVLTQLWQTSGIGTQNSVTPPGGLIVTGKTYKAQVESWDTKARMGDDHRTASQNFTYVRDQSVGAVSSLTATPTAGSPEVVLEWTRATQPDFFALRVNGVEVLDRIVPIDVFVSGTTYRMSYWAATPRTTNTYEIEAVVQTGGAGNPYRHSGPNPSKQAKTDPVGVWLVDETDNTSVQIADKNRAEFGIGESGATFHVIGSKAPIRVTDIVRGYEGPISGRIFTAADRADFLKLKARRSTNFRLIVGDLSIPVRIEEASVAPTPAPGDQAFDVGFSFFQAGPPWPVA